MELCTPPDPDLQDLKTLATSYYQKCIPDGGIIKFLSPDELDVGMSEPKSIQPASDGNDEQTLHGVRVWHRPADFHRPYYAQIPLASGKNAYLGSYNRPEVAARVHDAVAYLLGYSNVQLNYAVVLPFILPLEAKVFIEKIVTS
eukprot:TRINITY_DN10329_c0_g2_i1.p1 TRINITY_DN10329_c0_g2~~TRINITY_DN10329_c0_g2_i1.p1  ORF type:complete len:154 (+),score=36.39 TRINITY_DN10329_c0_g2_i1:32-463(+)